MQSIDFQILESGSNSSTQYLTIQTLWQAPTVNLSTMLANLTGITEGTVDGSGSTIGYVGFAFDFNNDNSIGLEFSDTSITVLQNSSQLANSTVCDSSFKGPPNKTLLRNL